MIAVDFLKLLRFPGPWMITAIVPDTGTVTTKTFNPSNESELREFVATNDGKGNLYYGVNPSKKAMSKKASKTDIAAVEYLFADLDPREDETSEAAKDRYTETLKTFTPPPTAIINSGNGLQCLWKLDQAIDLTKGKGKAAIADLEARTAALMRRLGGKAGTQNIDRILRLPGTTNLPNKKKTKEGRVACPTKLIRFNGAVHPLHAFPLATEEKAHGDPSDRSIDVDALPISDRIKKLIRGIQDPEHPYASRSEAVFAVILAMVGGDCADDQIEAVLLNPELSISAHVLEQPAAQDYLTRQIAKAREAAADPDVAKLNEKYALVLIGDKAVVVNTSGEVIKLLAASAFKMWFANRSVRRGDKDILLANYWLSHKQRRQYEGVVFSPLKEVPGHFNLWRGFKVQPREGDCSKFLTHLKDNVCGGNNDYFNWVVGWFANIVQHPDKKAGTSLVLRGKQGVGKTIVGKVMRPLLGTHYVLVTKPRYVTGQFNAHLVSCLLLHADEGFWAGDKTAEGTLKDMVTGDQHPIEYKGKEVFWVANHINLLVTGNADWIVPAGFEERRFAVLDVSEAHIQDSSYFKGIVDEMENGGSEALLHHLMSFNLDSVNLSVIPTTAALLEQKLSTLGPEQGWWLDILDHGDLPHCYDGPGVSPTGKLFESYIKHAQRQGVRRRSIQTQIGMFLSKHVPGLRKRLVNDGNNLTRVDVPGYEFPELAICRASFAKMMRQEFDWPEKKSWGTEVTPPKFGGDGGGEGPF